MDPSNGGIIYTIHYSFSVVNLPITTNGGVSYPENITFSSPSCSVHPSHFFKSQNLSKATNSLVVISFPLLYPNLILKGRPLNVRLIYELGLGEQLALEANACIFLAKERSQNSVVKACTVIWSYGCRL